MSSSCSAFTLSPRLPRFSRGSFKEAPCSVGRGLVCEAFSSVLSSYFNVSISELLGEETKKAPAETGKRSVSTDAIKFALFKGRDNITDEMLEEVLNFAEYVARREEEKKRKD